MSSGVRNVPDPRAAAAEKKAALAAAEEKESDLSEASYDQFSGYQVCVRERDIDERERECE